MARIIAVLALILSIASCGWFGGPEGPAPESDSEAGFAEEGSAEGDPETGIAEQESADPYAAGVLNAVVSRAPANGKSQFLAGIAEALGWGPNVQADPYLRKAISEGAFEQRVEPRLMALFFREGFSVLPAVGEGHEFTRDTLVRGKLRNARYFVRSAEAVRIVFLERVENIIIVYPKHGEQPQVFSRIAASTVALRESRLEHYLN